jgi:hypothetical protein
MAGLTDGGHTGVVCSVGQSLDRIGRRSVYIDGPVAEALKYSIWAGRIRDEDTGSVRDLLTRLQSRQSASVEKGLTSGGSSLIEAAQQGEFLFNLRAHLLSGDDRGPCLRNSLGRCRLRRHAHLASFSVLSASSTHLGLFGRASIFSAQNR